MKKEGLFSFFPFATPKRYQELLRIFGSIDNVWDIPISDFLRLTKWKPEVVHNFFEWKKSVDEEKIREELEKYKISCITQTDTGYPPILAQISDPPICLFVQGTLSPTSYKLAVVGTRKPSRYGTEVAQKFVSELANDGLTIVSGLALGIDAIAHRSTLGAKGITVAVLGSGLDPINFSPQTNWRLAQEIIANGGAVISEYPPGSEATPYTFPRRNRIIAGLCLGTLVIEAGENSGTLITARMCLDYNREVFAIPQNITSPTAIGTNNLLKQGAHLVSSAQDIFEVLNIARLNEPQITKTSEPIPTHPILRVLTNEPIHIDEIGRNCEIFGAKLNAEIMQLELKGFIKNVGMMMYVRVK